MAEYIKGIDISKWKPFIDWEKLKAQSIRFVYIKATQGTDAVDPKFLDHWTAAKQAGLLRGAYHFMDPDMDGRRQAENFLNTVHLEQGDLPPALDIETLPAAALLPTGGKKGEKGGGSKVGKGTKGTKRLKPDQVNAQILTCAKVWLDTVQSRLDLTPYVYTRTNFITTRLSIGGKPPSWSSKFPLWIAQYFDPPMSENTLPDHAKGWPDFTFWQYSNCGKVDGVYDDQEHTQLADVDLDYFKGTLPELYALAGAPLPEEG